MNAEIWGPHAWMFLHSITLVYPHQPTTEEEQYYYNFFDNLQNILPCEICKSHYKQHLIDYPLMDNLNSKDSLIRWLINVHNKINIMKGKPEWTYQEVIDHYDKIYENPYIKLRNNTGLWIFLLLIGLFICIYYIKKKKK
tara:strand:+ start:458 stop:877 length:420 start_codon:yes stop_codon:yes gene_type:complete